MPSNPIPSLPSSTPSWGGSGMSSSPYSTAAAAGGGGATQRESSFHRKRPTLGISEGKSQRLRLKNTCFSKIKNTTIAFVVSNWPFWKSLNNALNVASRWKNNRTVQYTVQCFFSIQKQPPFLLLLMRYLRPLRYLRGGWHHLLVKTRQTNNQGRAVVR